MSLRSAAISILAAAAVASPLVSRQSNLPDFQFVGDAPFSVAKEDLAAALNCPNGYPTADKPPVLLVHGTACTGSETWGDGFVPALLANGYTACFIEIPNRSMDDMQISTQYVAYNLHQISMLSGGLKTAVMAHSQGNPNTQWSLQFWPSTRNVTSSYVAISPDFAGIDLAGTSLLEALCTGDLCQASMWQQSAGSHYYDSLHTHDFRAVVPTTSIWTEYDGVVTPAKPNAQLPGAIVYSVQQLCPLRADNHITMTLSSASFAIALDAIQNEGQADMSRLWPHMLGTCLRATARGMNVDFISDVDLLMENIGGGFVNFNNLLADEPPIQPYAVMPGNK